MTIIHAMKKDNLKIDESTIKTAAPRGALRSFYNDVSVDAMSCIQYDDRGLRGRCIHGIRCILRIAPCCELLGFTSSKKKDISAYLKTFYAHSVTNPHGWGMMYEDGVRVILREAVSANESTAEAAISFYNKDLEEHEKRYDYLYRRILLVLPKPNALRPKISGHGASECFVCPTCGKKVEKGDWKCNACNQPLDWP